LPEEPEDESIILEGVAAALVATILFAGALVLLASGHSAIAQRLVIPMVFGIGITQVVYVGPIAILFLHYRRRKAAIGAIIFAAVVFLLNAACWGLVVSNR
jgi:hypothetical protein